MSDFYGDRTKGVMRTEMMDGDTNQGLTRRRTVLLKDHQTAKGPITLEEFRRMEAAEAASAP